MYKIYFSVNTSLPPTAYMKMIDVWFLFNLLKPFVDIIVQTFMETLREHPEENHEKEEFFTKDFAKNFAWIDNGKTKESMNALKYTFVYNQ